MKMIFDIEQNVIKSLKIVGGCPGNTVGVSRLVEGRTIDEVIEMLKGIECGVKGKCSGIRKRRVFYCRSDRNTGGFG